MSHMPCPLCGRDANNEGVSWDRLVQFYSGCACGKYYIDTAKDIMPKGASEDVNELRRRISALLGEWTLMRSGIPLLVTRDGAPPETDRAVPVRVGEFLNKWPETVPEQIERSFKTLVQRIGVGAPGRTDRIRPEQLRDWLPLGVNDEGAAYFLEALQASEWITRTQNAPWGVRVTPKGWAKFDELNRTNASRDNPVFVAMWFGGDPREEGNRCEKMTSLYQGSIRPAVEASGYRVMRAGELEHNEPVMDRVIDDIRRAPFVVAELTNGNQGVYYEAGLARGRGIEVIYCVPETDDPEDKPHFDVTGINHVRWKDPGELRKKLENRILGSIGRGPHEFQSGAEREAVGGKR